MVSLARRNPARGPEATLRKDEKFTFVRTSSRTHSTRFYASMPARIN